MQICLRIPKDEVTLDGSRVVCFYIPQLTLPWWRKFRNPGEPVEILTDGWIRSELISTMQARDLSILATVHELVGQLSPQLQRSLEVPVNQAFNAIELPTFATLSFDSQLQKEEYK